MKKVGRDGTITVKVGRCRNFLLFILSALKFFNLWYYNNIYSY